MKHSVREHQRAYLTFYLRIFKGDNFLGFLIDISTNGFMLLTEFPLEEKELMFLRMKLPESLAWEGETSSDRFIEFTAETLWSKPDENRKDFFLTGFKIIDMTEEDNEVVHNMIKEFKIK